MLNFYWRFLPNALELQGPLIAMISVDKKNNSTVLECNEDRKRHFGCLSLTGTLCYVSSSPTWRSNFLVSRYVQFFSWSNFKSNGKWWISTIGVFSRKLTNWNVVYYKPLVFAFRQQLHKASCSQVRQLDFKSQSSTVIRLVKTWISRIHSLTTAIADYLPYRLTFAGIKIATISCKHI